MSGDQLQLTFFLPADLKPRPVTLPADASGAELELTVLADDNIMVKVRGPSRAAVFGRVRQFLTAAAVRDRARVIEAAMKVPGGYDPVMILLDVGIGFVFTAMPVDFGDQEPNVVRLPKSINHANAGDSRLAGDR